MRSRHCLAALAVGLAPLLALADQAAAPGVAAPVAAAPVGAAPVAAAPVDSAPVVAAPVVAVPSAARAPVPAPAPVPATSPTAGPSAGNLMQTIFGLTVVLGVLFGLAWFLKRYGPKAGTGSANLRVVGALNLGGRERIMVVEVGDQWIVVGAAPGRVNALATMPKQEGAPLHSTLSAHQPAAGSFGEWLKQTIDKRNAK